MNFQNLEYFLAVAREKNITRAADQLGISQQALSNQIARMEQELGCSLFDRRHGFELTYSGRYFLESANKILDINNQTENFLNDINKNRRGELKIGISFTRGQAILPLLLPEFHQAHPHVSISVHEASSRVLEEYLEKGLIDILIGYTPFLADTVRSVQLMREHLYFTVPKELMHKIDPVAFHKKPDLAQFQDLPFVLLKKGDRIRDLVDAEFRLYRISPEITMETDNIQTAFALSAEGMGIGVVPELYINSPFLISGEATSPMRDNIVLLPFSDNDTRNTIQIALGYNENRYLSQATRDFMQLCERKFRQMK